MHMAINMDAARHSNAAGSPAKNFSAQGAVEYLVLLGAVLVIAVIVVALLGMWPSMGGDMRNNEQSSYWLSSQPFGIKDTQQSGQTGVNLSVINHAPRPLTLTSITLIYMDGHSFTNNTRIDFGAGETLRVYIPGNANMLDCATHSGRSVPYNVTMLYDDDPLTGKVESGSQALPVHCG